jgi:SAM-dependent methyltransferase
VTGKRTILLNLGAGPHTLEGFTNLDYPWRFEDGLALYGDGSVDGITISHALMYLPLSEWPAVFQEFARVLAPGGVVRITEDDCENPESERFAKPWPDAATLTGPEVVRRALRAAGLKTRLQAPDTSGFRDLSLCQAWHGAIPKVFFIEGRKP